MSNTFSKSVSFLSLVFDQDKNEWFDKTVEKTATFHELSRRDRKQHKLHFAIVSLFSKTIADEDGENKVNLDSDEIYDLTVRAVKDLMITSDQFTETDKKELLNDSGALVEFGFSLISEKIIPFFQILMTK